MDTSVLENPLNWILALIFFYFAYQLSIPKQKATLLKHPEVIELRNFTAKELQVFNGVQDSRIYLAVRGKVYDVTRSAGFYGPGSSYENFAGRDASRGLAKNSFDPSVLTPVDKPLDRLDDLTREETQSLNEWESHFVGKYNMVGYLIE
ncbi:cytochrome b5-like heme/steroid binding domain-containing protein [Gorgonomyces haynaldii]|nr:cytochrome b5-like heme/steroid binding domain-containing protein [Gorgonomyces haynaldii]